MIPLSISEFTAEIGEHDENAIPKDELPSSTSDAVKESQIQVSFAEQTASEMRQILSDWNSAASPEKKQRHEMRRNSLALMDVMQERTERRNLSNSSLVTGKIDVQSPTNTIQTDMIDSESEISEGSYLDESLRLNDSFVSDEDNLPHVSFLPSSAVLQQSTEVDSIMRKTERQTSELDQTFHATKYNAVMIDLQDSYESFMFYKKTSTDPSIYRDEGPREHVEETDSSPTAKLKMANQSMQSTEMKKQNQGRSQQLFTYVLLPIAISILVARVLVKYAEAEEDLH